MHVRTHTQCTSLFPSLLFCFTVPAHLDVARKVKMNILSGICSAVGKKYLTSASCTCRGKRRERGEKRGNREGGKERWGREEERKWGGKVASVSQQLWPRAGKQTHAQTNSHPLTILPYPSLLYAPQSRIELCRGKM